MGGKYSKDKNVIRLTFYKQELQELEESFNLFDENKDGKISIKELANIMKRIDMPMSKKDLQIMFDEVDLDQNGMIDFGEFLIMMKKYEIHIAKEDEMRRMFNMFDVRGQGQITAADLKVALSKIGEPATDAEVEGMMLEAGVEKDEYITFSHFKELCKRLSLI
ncbi:neo-calmodulin-like isoform X1 [Diabrotica undecimpunctata]|uniref:neo-calmodulin-like isoform X1 n=1 Tax=Diabrotica undecimpunctata TaxID=50387 RepID=UPI003B63C9DD